MSFLERLQKMLDRLPSELSDETARLAVAEFLEGRDISQAILEAVNEGRDAEVRERTQGRGRAIIAGSGESVQPVADSAAGGEVIE